MKIFRLMNTTFFSDNIIRPARHDLLDVIGTTGKFLKKYVHRTEAAAAATTLIKRAGQELAPKLGLKVILTVLSGNQLFLTNILAQEMKQKYIFAFTGMS